MQLLYDALLVQASKPSISSSQSFLTKEEQTSRAVCMASNLMLGGTPYNTNLLKHQPKTPEPLGLPKIKAVVIYRAEANLISICL